MSDHPDPTVLIVDDEPALADGHAARLEDVDTRTAYGGEEALEALDDDVDVVLLDRRMPGMSGEDVLENIRAREIDCRVVMLTGVEPSVDIVSMPFDEYLVKPVTTEELSSAVQRMCRRSAYDSKLREFYSLAAKRATLETRHGRDDLEDRPEYRHLCDRLEAVAGELDEVLDDLPEEDGYLVATEPADARSADGVSF